MQTPWPGNTKQVQLRPQIADGSFGASSLFTQSGDFGGQVIDLRV